MTRTTMTDLTTMMQVWIPVLLTLATVSVTAGVERSRVTEPVYETQGVNVTVIEGKTAILPCSVHDASSPVAEKKPVKVVWTDQWSTILTFRDERVIDDERIHVDHTLDREWNLRVERVKYGDQGIYTCQVNTDPVISYTVHLTVVVPPRLTNDNGGGVQEVTEGSKAELVCNATGIPAPTITWFRKGMDAGDRRERIGETGQVLVIHNVTRHCGGIYVCVAENGVPPSVRREIRVQVNFKPEVTLPTKRISQAIGKDTILECMVSAHPQGQAKWKFHGRQITSNDKYSVNIYPQTGTDMITLSLDIRRLEPGDFGKYNCIASNSLGETSKKMTLSELVIRTTSTTTTTTTTTTPSPPRVAPPPRVKPGGPQVGRRVHSEGRDQSISWQGQAVPPQTLDSNTNWPLPAGDNADSGAKAGRVAGSSCGPLSSTLVMLAVSFLLILLLVS